MNSFSCASIPGYKRHLPTQVVRLPLKYAVAAPKNGSPIDFFHQNTALCGAFVDLKDHTSSFVDLVACELLNDLTTITLAPLNLDHTLNIALQNLCIQLPHKVVSKDCFSVRYFRNEAGETALVVDLIDEKFLFITVVLSLDDFVVNSVHKFSLGNFSAWGNISVPYSFELRSAPFLLKPVDENNYIVSLKDGGLLHFNRPSPLLDFNIFNFTESSALLSLNIFSGIFRSGSAPQGKTSDSSVVDILVFEDKVVTLSVCRTVKLWDLKTHTELTTPVSLTGVSGLTAIPARYLFKVSHDGKDYVMFHTSNSFQTDQGIKFNIWEVSGNEFVGSKDFNIELPVTDAEYSNKIWFIQDFHAHFEADGLRMLILWKSNISTILINYLLDVSELSILSIERSYNYEDEKDYLQVHDKSYYQDEVLKSGLYDQLILETAVNTLRENLKLPKAKDELLIHETIQKLNESNDENNSWFILHSLCEEYKKLSEESLALCVTAENKTVTLQTNGIGIYRELSTFEEFETNVQDKFNAKLTEVSNTLSIKTFNEVYQYITGLSSIEPANLTYIAETILKNKFTSSDISDIVRILETYPDVMNKIDVLINGEKIDFFIPNTQTLSIANKNYMIVSFKSIIRVHQKLLIKLIVLFANFEENSRIVDLCNQILKRLNDYNLLQVIFNSNKSYEDSILWLDNFNVGNINQKFSRLNSLINEEDYLVNVIIELINVNEDKSVFKSFMSKIDFEKNKFLIGVIYLSYRDLAHVDFLQYANYKMFKKQNNVVLKSIEANDNLKAFISAVQSDDSETTYYHSLSQVFERDAELITESSLKKEFINYAIEFELKAIGLIEDPNAIEQYYINVFNLSLSSINFDKLLVCLNELKGNPNFNFLVKKLLKKLLELNQITNIFEFKFFLDNYKLVDSLLAEIASNEPLFSSVKIYQILYSWRLFNDLTSYKILDKRGSIESLYLFISRFEKEGNAPALISASDIKEMYLKILEFYLIIMNCLKSFESDDEKWLIKYDESNSIVTLKDIQIEYMNYLKKLNSL